MRKSVFIVVVLFFTMLACSTSAPDFSGEWSLDYIEVGEEKMYSNHLSNPKYFFSEDGKYGINVSGIIQEGTWKYKNESVYLKDASGNITEIKIINLDSENFTYRVDGEEGMTSIVHLKK
jgi:hypothetical protein